MMHLICFDLRHSEDNIPFLDAIDAIGPNIEIFDGCYLVEANVTALSIRKSLLPHLSELDRLFVTTVYRNHSAGQLNKPGKEFAARYISPDPLPKKATNEHYSF